MLNIPIKDYFRETRLFGARLSVVAVICLALIGLLFVRLVYLQVVKHPHYTTLAQANRIRPLPVPPVRGQILDRHGVVLAQSYPVYTLEIIPEQVEDMSTLLEKLGQLVRLTENDLKQFRKQLRERPRFEQLTLRAHLTPEEAARVAVRRPFLNGVEIEARLQRHYPLGGLAVHALGYVGRISESDLERVDRTAYRGLRHIGKLGVEASYEKPLLGRVGIEQIETNAHGRALRIIERTAPRAGEHVVLHLDAELQKLAESLLGKRRGAVVALEPKTGAVLAFASTPTYDPNLFVEGIDPETYRRLLEDPDRPLFNRALNGLYPPGSTIKVFLGLAALERPKPFQPDKTLLCTGSFALAGSRYVFRDWKRTGHGPVSLHEAIVQSCDVYFYQLATQLGPEFMKDWLTAFGFGRRTGIDIPGESEGLVPSPAWKQQRGQPWFAGETVVMGIGQGPIQVTPLQLASAVSALANGGVRMKPRLVSAIVDPKTGERRAVPPEAFPPLALGEPSHLETLIRYMTDVVHSNKGTAYGIGWNAPYRIAGKTGTAQVASMGEHYNEKRTPERLRDHALFIAFAPVEDPKVAVAVIVENGGHGSAAAAPIARRIMDQVILGHEAARQTGAAPKMENEE
jgi:penicillin-binding protein 2